MAATTSPPTIRLTAPDDLDALYTLARESFFLDRFSRNLLAEKLFQQSRPEAFQWRVYLAEDQGQPVGFLQAAARPAAHKAWLGLGGVVAAHRRRGIATALLRQAEADWPADINEVEVLAIPGNYFLPGIDPRYTEALCFAARHGFERFNDCVNLTADLTHTFDTTAETQRLATQNVTVRRATVADGPLLDAFFADNFGADWRFEAGLALGNDPVSLHLAFRNDQMIAFSAHSTQNAEWGFFGPMGTTPAARGLGIGRVLLWHCLNDMHDAGHRTAVIPWVGPITFYHQWAGCRVERVFWRYRRQQA